METVKTYENFPVWMVVLANLVSVLIYISGMVITLRLSWIAGVMYAAYILALEYRLLSRHCTNCYYWGKTCGFGQGRLSAFFFKKGNPSEFCINNFTWKDLIPDLMVSLAPLIIGIILMIIRFDVIILAASFLLIVLTTSGNGLIRGNIACKYCRQREIGCPAEKLFSKAQQK